MFFVSFGKGVGKGKVCVGCYTQDEELKATTVQNYFQVALPASSYHRLHHPYNHLKHQLEGNIWIMNALMLENTRTATPWDPKRVS